MYLAFRNFKIKLQKCNQSNQKKDTSTTDAFGVSISLDNGCLMSLEVEMQKVVYV